MATENYRYDHPAYLARYSAAVPLSAVAASAVAGKFVAFTAMKIKSIRGVVDIVGTNAAAGYTISNGTTSFASATVGTNAAGSAIPVTMTEQTLAAGGYINFTALANTGTTANSFVIEYEIIPGSDVTA